MSTGSACAGSSSRTSRIHFGRGFWRRSLTLASAAGRRACAYVVVADIGVILSIRHYFVPFAHGSRECRAGWATVRIGWRAGRRAGALSALSHAPTAGTAPPDFLLNTPHIGGRQGPSKIAGPVHRHTLV